MLLATIIDEMDIGDEEGQRAVKHVMMAWEGRTSVARRGGGNGPFSHFDVGVGGNATIFKCRNEGVSWSSVSL